MRGLLTVLSFLSVAALAFPVALAQDPDRPGCTQGNPCEVVVDLDAKGIDIAQTDFTAGDWLILSVFNGDNVTHTVSMASPKVSLTVAKDDIDDTSPFQLDHAGSYTLTDSPTRDTATLTASAADSFSGSSSSGAARSKMPGVEPALLLLALAGMAAVLRRR